MKHLHLLGSAAVAGLTFLAGTPVFAHGGHHSGGHHSGGHHSSSHHSGGSHHGTAHHAAPHHSAPHHAAPSHAGAAHPAHSHVAGHPHAQNHSFAQQGYHSHHHHGWNHGNWNYGGGWYTGPWGVWDGSTVNNTVTPWYYETFFDVEPEVAVLPENGPTVSRGSRNAVRMPTSPLCRPATTGLGEQVATESDGN
jgi:hypothetical protein